MALSIPIGVSLGVVVIAYIFVWQSVIPVFFIQGFINSLDIFPILAVPLFMLSGELMTKGGIARQLFNIAHKCVGGIVGGHALSVVLTCLLFSSMSGSGPATVAAIGGLMIPMMTEIGYDKKFTTALVATAGGLGMIIPPSIAMVMFGVVTGTSVSDLFLAGILPGILVAICLMVYAYIYCKITKPVIKWNEEEKSFGEVLKEAKWSILMPIIILGGIYGGIFTPTEAAGIAVFYAFIVCIFVTKTIKLVDIISIFRDSAAMMGPLMIIVATATLFGRILALERAPLIIADFVRGIANNPITLLLVINALLLILGTVTDTIAAILILAPVLLPIVQSFGINPVHFGIIMIVNLAIGFVTPPVGMNLYVASGLTGISITEISKKAVWPIVAFLVALMIITFVPGLSLFFVD